MKSTKCCATQSYTTQTTEYACRALLTLRICCLCSSYELVVCLYTNNTEENSCVFLTTGDGSDSDCYLFAQVISNDGCPELPPLAPCPLLMTWMRESHRHPQTMVRCSLFMRVHLCDCVCLHPHLCCCVSVSVCVSIYVRGK